MSATPHLHLVGVTRRYPAQHARPSDAVAVADVDLVASKGELTAILGESGSGKTTLLRLIAGFEPLDSGTIAIAGALVADTRRSAPPEQRSVGMVFQQTALLPHLSVRANVAFGLHQLRPDERERRVNQMLELMGLEEFARRYPHEISGGQAQRTALARALAPAPALLLLDEPFNNLDAGLKWPLIAELRRLLALTETTALFVTHERDEAFAFADQIAILHRGRIVQTGKPEVLYSQPVSSFVASYLGATNLIPVERTDSETRPAGDLGSLGGLSGRHTLETNRGCAVSIRPSELQIDAAGSNGRGVRGQVESLRFLGERREVTVIIDQTKLIVYVPALRRLDVGDSVTVTLSGEA